MKKEITKIEPEKILRTIKRDEFRKNRGKLKIFFGMAAGVGKTYSMLEYAHRLKSEGVDIAIGYIETHGRAETVNLVNGLEIIKRKKVEYKNIIMEEMDIDAVIERNPKAILIDELAHTNAAGSRHAKRYLDVVEILDYGIDVYTTLNIQHLESYSATVEEITGVIVRETIPDRMLEYADSIELVDISPEDLLKRLEEGKVYTKEKSKTALENFFKKENLTALREMSLRYTAKKVDRQLQEFLEDKNKIWKTGDKLLVAVSPSPNSEYLVKYAKRVSYNQKSEWMVVYVEKKTKLSVKDEASLKTNLDLARELGAEVITTYDDDVVNGILRIAYQKNISQIITGKTVQKNIIDRIRGAVILDRLINESRDIDIIAVTQPGISKKPAGNYKWNLESSYKDYLFTTMMIISATILNLFLYNFTGYWTIGLIYLSLIPICAIFFGRGPVILAAGLSALCWDFLFIPPRFTFYIGKIEDILMFVLYFIFALVTGNLTSRLHLKEKALRIREKRISDLYEISSTISNTKELDEIIKNSVVLVEKFLEAKTVFFLVDEDGYLEKNPHKESNLDVNEKEYGVALWSFENKKSSGKFTETLPMSDIFFNPLLGADNIYGVVGFSFSGLNSLKLEQENFIKTIVRLIAISIERDFLIRKMQNAKISSESERLYKIILNSISHELRTPLTSITNASSGLFDEKMFKDPEIRNTLLSDIKESADRMNRVVGNILNMVRIESGKLKLTPEWNDVNDLVNAVLNKLNENLTKYVFAKEVSNELPLLFADYGLIEQVLTNILLNAMQHNKEGTEIFLKIYKKDNQLFFAVKDNGEGIPEKEQDKIFDKFYRVTRSRTGGTGLGLSICKSIIELHEGKIFVQSNDDKGVTFIVCLPVKETGIREKL